MMTAPSTDLGIKLKVGIRKARAKRITPPTESLGPISGGLVNHNCYRMFGVIPLKQLAS